MKTNKYLYGWLFFGNYGAGWEYECFEETRAGMKENRKAYRESSPYPLKIRRGRTLNPDYPHTEPCQQYNQPRAWERCICPKGR